MCTLGPVLFWNPQADGLAFKKGFVGGGGRYYTEHMAQRQNDWWKSLPSVCTDRISV